MLKAGLQRPKQELTAPPVLGEHNEEGLKRTYDWIERQVLERDRAQKVAVA